MPPLIQCRDLTKSFGARPLFEGVSITVSEGDRLGLIGPNGAGKSTLLKILAGLETPDSGERSLRKLTRLGYVPQDSFFPAGLTVRNILEAAAAGQEDDLEASVNTTLGAAGLTDPDVDASLLSGGWRKRLAIAEQLIARPDILLLDEPTNHLDLEGIAWLERLIANGRFAVVAVSHDRYFLENAVTSMAELSARYPGGLFRTDGPYSEFLEKRAAFLEAQAKLEDSLAVKVRREVEWLRRGAKARTTKAKARVDEANRLIAELEEVAGRGRTSVAKIDFTASERKTKKLVETKGLACVVNGRTLWSGLDLTLSPGRRIGLVGANGSGKTTLLRVLAGEREPSAGSVTRAEQLRIVYFEQNRSRLDPEMPLRRALAPHGDSVVYNGRVLHVAGWAQRFLFRKEQLEVAVGKLSGGERARVIIARLMLEPADLLLLDEPTNDLDIPTLEVLEESLLEFPGAMVLVTHDRYLLDRVSTSVVGLDGEGGAAMYADYSQWEEAQAERRRLRSAAGPGEKAPPPPPPAPARRKLSYLEAREFEQMESRILAAEALLQEKKDLLHAPEVVTDGTRLQQVYREMEEAQAAVELLYERWAELESKIG